MKYKIKEKVRNLFFPCAPQMESCMTAAREAQARLGGAVERHVQAAADFEKKSFLIIKGAMK